MGEDRPAPDVTPARQFWRHSQCLERDRIELLDPTKRRGSAEGCHRASHVPLPRVASDGHDVPPSSTTSGHPCRSGVSVEPTGRRLLSTIAAAFNRPRRWPVARGGGSPVSSEHSRNLREATERSTEPWTCGGWEIARGPGAQASSPRCRSRGADQARAPRIALLSMNSSKPSSPHSRPLPDCL